MTKIGQFKDLTGTRFGNLTVIGRAEDYVYKSGRREVMWRCKCDCGNEVVVHKGGMHKGGTVSCGCAKRSRLTKHGLSESRLDRIFRGMKQRCYDKHAANYAAYGGRGVRICNEWLEDKQAFFDWAIHNGYDDSLSIDRVDVNGDYTPANCKWATNKEQSNNRRDNIRISYDGLTLSVAEWAAKTNIPYSTIYSRLRSGWSIEDALRRNQRHT